MRILVAGANGFIGSHITGALIEAGHHVVAAVRNPGLFLFRFPGAEAISVDFNRDTTPKDWAERLENIDAVVNCAGILRSRLRHKMEAVHLLAPRALFEACARCGVKRVIHVSAVSADADVGTPYASTKAAAEDTLRQTDLDWVILRPSLVYAAGSYGGTSLLRGLAALPGFIPVVGAGEQSFRPIHAVDLAAGIVRLLERSDGGRMTLEPAGPEILPLSSILKNLRAWLGFKPARIVHVPTWLARITARIGDLVSAAAFNTTALRQLEFGNAGDPAEFIRITGVSPAPMRQWLLRQPSHVQDRWHARLYWPRILLRYVLATLWIASGVIGLWPARDTALSLLVFAGFSSAATWALVAGTCVLDIVIGVAIVIRWRTRWLGLIQLAVVAGYTITLSIAAPGLWADPFGVLLKNLPILIAIGIWMVLEDDR